MTSLPPSGQHLLTYLSLQGPFLLHTSSSKDGLGPLMLTPCPRIVTSLALGLFPHPFVLYHFWLHLSTDLRRQKVALMTLLEVANIYWPMTSPHSG